MIHRRLHRWGIARRLNSGSNNFNDRGTAFIQTLGPRWLGRRLAVKAVHWSDIPADWDTIRIEKTQRVSRWHYRWLLAFRRI